MQWWRGQLCGIVAASGAKPPARSADVLVVVQPPVQKKVDHWLSKKKLHVEQNNSFSSCAKDDPAVIINMQSHSSSTSTV